MKCPHCKKELPNDPIDSLREHITVLFMNRKERLERAENKGKASTAHGVRMRKEKEKYESWLNAIEELEENQK